MNRLEIINFFHNFFEQRGLELDNSEIEQYNFIEEGGLDSFELLTMLIEIESQFGVKISPATLVDERNMTVGALISRLLAS